MVATLPQLHYHTVLHSVGPVPTTQRTPTAPYTHHVSPPPTVLFESSCSNQNPPQLPPTLLDWRTNRYKHEHNCILTSPCNDILSMEEEVEYLLLLPTLYWNCPTKADHICQELTQTAIALSFLNSVSLSCYANGTCDNTIIRVTFLKFKPY